MNREATAFTSSGFPIPGTEGGFSSFIGISRVTVQIKTRSHLIRYLYRIAPQLNLFSDRLFYPNRPSPKKVLVRQPLYN